MDDATSRSLVDPKVLLGKEEHELSEIERHGMAQHLELMTLPRAVLDTDSR